jgi:hypothetical protein
MKPGRKAHTGVLSGIQPDKETWTDICNRIIYDSAEWPLVALRSMLGAGLPDNFLSIEQAKCERALASHVRERHAIGRKYRKTPKKLWHALQTMTHKQPFMTQVMDAWRTLKARFERAVLDGDADWFKRQAESLSHVQSQEKIQFNAAVVRQLELRMWGTDAIPLPQRRAKERESTPRSRAGRVRKQHDEALRAYEQYCKDNPIGDDLEGEQRKLAIKNRHFEFYKTHPQYNLSRKQQAQQDRRQREHAAKIKPTETPQHDLTLTPAGKFADAMASVIYKALKPEKKRGVLRVADCPFESKEQAKDAIHKLAEKLHFALHKQH